MYRFLLTIILLGLSACATPTARLPSGIEHREAELTKVRRDLIRKTYRMRQNETIRLQTIFYRLIKSTGPELCRHPLMPDIGLSFNNTYNMGKKWDSFFELDLAQLLLDEDIEKIHRKYNRGVFIWSVAKDSPADKAGIKPGDRLISYRGIRLVPGKKAVNKLYEKLYAMPDDGLNIAVEVERRGEILNFSVKPDQICPLRLFYKHADHQINAYSNGKDIYVLGGLVSYMDDNEIAGVLGHELAHHNLGHMDADNRNSFILGFSSFMSMLIFGDANSADAVNEYAQLGRKIYSVDFEAEADYVSLYYMARAGYDYKKAYTIQEKLAALSLKGLYLKSDHPTSQFRYILLQETANEIDLKKSFGEELVPNFNKSNNYLLNKERRNKKWF